MVPWNRVEDNQQFHFFCFLIAGMTIYPILFFTYRRDTGGHKKNWVRREAMLVLLAREAAGVPLIDRNFVDPAKLELPTDEELDGAEVII